MAKPFLPVMGRILFGLSIAELVVYHGITTYLVVGLLCLIGGAYVGW